MLSNQLCAISIFETTQPTWQFSVFPYTKETQKAVKVILHIGILNAHGINERFSFNLVHMFTPPLFRQWHSSSTPYNVNHTHNSQSSKLRLRYPYMVEIWPLTTCLIPNFERRRSSTPNFSTRRGTSVSLESKPLIHFSDLVLNQLWLILRHSF